jgi:hypothetical protein
LQLARAVDVLIGSFDAPEQQNLAVTRLSMPLNSIVKTPSQEKWRTINCSNALIKPLFQSNKDAMETFLLEIGFKKLSDSAFKYQEPGNIRELQAVVDFMKERLTSGKIQVIQQVAE